MNYYYVSHFGFGILNNTSKTNGNCCFNHIIGLPTKEGLEKAIFDYKKILYDALLINDISYHVFKHKHLWVKKATGLGVTEFFKVDGVAVLEK